MRTKANDDHQLMLDSLCHLIHQKKIKEAENSLLALIEKIFSDSQNGSKKINDYIKMYKTMHHAFNNYYLNWLKKIATALKKKNKKFLHQNTTIILLPALLK